MRQPTSDQEMERKKIPSPTGLAPTSDDRATAQAEQHDLEKDASKHHRDEVARKIIAWGMWILMATVFAVVIFAVFTLGFHLLVPTEWRWLDSEELQEVKNAVLSGAVVGLGTTYLRKYIDERGT